LGVAPGSVFIEPAASMSEHHIAALLAREGNFTDEKPIG
jgi:hypothetical protein